MSGASERHERELERIREVYRRRGRVDRARYDPALPVNRFARRGQKRALSAALAGLGLERPHGRTLLDIGCGEGNWFAWFLDLGIAPEQIAGVELDPARAAACSERYPDCDVRVTDAASLPWPDGSFDVVFQSTVLSSIRDRSVRSAVAREMRRVLAPGGSILSYDFFVRRPGNREVLGIGGRELRRLFPDARVSTQRVTLARPLALFLARRAWPIARMLESFGWLNTHYFTVIQP